MIKYAIIEDNVFAKEHLRLAIKKLRPGYELTFTGDSVESAVEFLKDNEVNLIFMDIELSDGKCFSIFERIGTVVPVIFTTAYDEFAIQAFKVNGIDYLLKPVTHEALAHAIDKFEMLTLHRAADNVAPKASEPGANEPVSRILTVSGDKYNYININDIAYFMSEENYVFAYLHKGRRCMINLTNLSELEGILPSDRFFRLSRNIIASIESIVSAGKYFRGRLLVKLKSSCGEKDVTISATRRDQFLSWLGK